MDKLRVLVACEFSGTVRDAFTARGHDAWSCDLRPSEKAGNHLQCDAIDAIFSSHWDLLIAHPPCTYLSQAGARWWKCDGRMEKAKLAAQFVFMFRDAPVEKIAIENPQGLLSKFWRQPDQIIQPHFFGDPYTKKTCLWLKNLPPLFSTILCGNAEAWIPSNTGGKKRLQKTQKGVVRGSKNYARTFPGIAAAMANQWGNYV